MGSSSSICSLLTATTLGVIVPDRDEGEEGRGEVGKLGMQCFRRKKKKMMNSRSNKLKKIINEGGSVKLDIILGGCSDNCREEEPHKSIIRE